jgi:hypothetical protein
MKRLAGGQRISVVVLGLCVAVAACEPTQPEVVTVDVHPGRQLRVSGGFVLSEARVQLVYARLTQQVAVALQDADVRGAVHDGLHASPFKENKVHFRTFLQGAGRALLEALASNRAVTSEAALRTLDSIVDLEFYMPVKDHWAEWDGDDNLLVASALTDDRFAVPLVFNLAGASLAASHFEPPPVPTLVIVPSETDFSRPPANAVYNRTPSAAVYESGVVMTYAYVDDNKSPWFDGAPELETHSFVRDGSGNFNDEQCAGDEQSYPFEYNQDDEYFTGSVQLILEDGIGANPVEFSMWEDDGTEDPSCQPNYGRPPNAASDVIEDFGDWSARQVTVVSLNGQVKIIGFDDLGIPLALVDEGNNNDDPVGELQGPVNDCWPSTGAARYNLYEPGSGHPYNGYAYLDFNYGDRDSVCTSSPPPMMSVTISGPNEVQSTASCTWAAYPSGGSGGYTYSWAGVLTGSSAQVSGSVSQSGWLYVDVVSGDDQRAGEELYVTVSPSGSECLEWAPRQK